MQEWTIKDGHIIWDCGCKAEIVGPPRYDGGLPLVNITEFPLCKRTADLLAKGLTKGVFQLEKLGPKYCKDLKPETLEHMAALAAILRPGCLQVKDERGVSTTDNYCRRKNNLDKWESQYPEIDDILKETYSLILYQEQIMKIAHKLAGYNLNERDMLRKHVGKKDMAKLSAIGKDFVDRAEKLGIVTREKAEAIFNDIKKSGRYSFNASHAYSYGVLGVETSYLKAHCPLQFFASWLYHAKGKSDAHEEIGALISDAKRFDIIVAPPDIRNMCKGFHLQNGQIQYGLGDIKGLGDSKFAALFSAAENTKTILGKEVSDLTWNEFLFYILPAISSKEATSLCRAGAFAWTGKTRERLVNELLAVNELTKTELPLAQKGLTEEPVSALLKRWARPKKEGGICSNKNRCVVLEGAAKLLDNPPASEADHPNLISGFEEELLGIALSCSVVDSFDVNSANNVAASKAVIVCQIKSLREIKTKKGKNPGQKMGFASITDGTGEFGSVVIFPDPYSLYGSVLREGAVVVFDGYMDKQSSFVVNKAYRPA